VEGVESRILLGFLTPDRKASTINVRNLDAMEVDGKVMRLVSGHATEDQISYPPQGERSCVLQLDLQFERTVVNTNPKDTR